MWRSNVSGPGAICLVVVLVCLPGLLSATGDVSTPGDQRPADPARPAEAQKAPDAKPGAPDSGLRFTDVTAPAGIRFRHNSGAFGKKYLPETLGSGVAFLDFDNDGWQDLVFVNSMNWPGRPGAPSLPALYHNNHNGTFTDVTKQAGLATQMYGLGVAAADFDNDGDIDIYITCLGPNHLFSNLGGGKFSDVTARAGVGDPGFSTSAAWFDYDRDGRLDLFVANYVQWTIATDLTCMLDGRNKSYCTPESYKGQSSTLYHNKGDGTFEDVTRKAGLYDPTSKSLGVALIDYDNDGRMDLFVANDTQPNRLYKNRGDGTFVDVGMMAGVAFNEAGVARAGMGVDAADYDGSGRQSLIIGNFSNEMMALYSNEGTGLFIDDAPTSTVGKASLLTLTFACFFFDVDLDGLLDIFAANGHVSDDIGAVQPKVTYAQRPHLFRNVGWKKFEEVSARVGQAFQQAVVARGAAYGDFDNDGDLDLAITTNNGPARLLRNDRTTRNGAVRVALEGAASNHDAIGARVRLEIEDGRKPWAMIKTGSSYCSQSELPLTFGLGRAAKVTSIEVTWPNGKVEKVTGVAANQAVTIREGKGIVRTAPLAASQR
jgi:enediyne biosynthesis protein E4